jgi:hypothetical protein
LRLTEPRSIAEDAFRFDLDAHEAAYGVRALIDGLSVDCLFRSDEPFESFRWRLHMIDAHVLRPLREAELTEVLTACWIITENWLTFLESSGQPITYEQFQVGSQIIASVLHPYLIER